MIINQKKEHIHYSRCENATLKSSIINIVSRGKFVFVTLRNGEKYRVGEDGYLVRAEVRFV